MFVPKVPMSIPNAHLAKLVQVIRGISEDDRSQRSLRRDVQRELSQMDTHQTHYGTLIETLDIRLSDGEDYKLPYIQPFALLHTLTLLRTAYGDMLRRSVQDGMGKARLILRRGEAGEPAETRRGAMPNERVLDAD